MRRTRNGAVGAVLLTFAVSGCARNPATGERELMLVSEAQEIELGREYDREVVAAIGLYGDDGWQRYVQALGTRLAEQSERPQLPWTFRVVDDPTVNAFALPGGFIYVTRGIVAHLNSEAELAAVLGHEIGHVTARHTASQVTRQQLAQLGLGVASLASADIARYAGVAGQALGVLFLKFSRDDERQADDLGLRYLEHSRFDPREMPAVFRMLEQVSSRDDGGRLPDWLATHPNPRDRFDRVTEQIAKLPARARTGVVNRDAYQQRLDGLVFGDDPREGYFREERFLHPGLGFQIAFPDGWVPHNGKQAVTAVSPEQDAAVELSLAPQHSAAAAVRAFVAQDGVSADPPESVDLDGLPAVGASFAAAAEYGTIRGSVLFVEHGDAVFRLVGYATERQWAARRPMVERALTTFSRFDGGASPEPLRLDIVRVDRATTIADLARERPTPVPAAMLALLNQVEPQTVLDRGRRVKWVVGQRPDPALGAASAEQ